MSEVFIKGKIASPVLTPLESVLLAWLRMVFDVPVEAIVEDITLSASSPGKHNNIHLTGIKQP